MYLKSHLQIGAVETEVGDPGQLICLKRSLFVTVNDDDCAQIITADLSLSHLLDCLPFSLSLSLSYCLFFSFFLSVTFSSIETLFKPSTESKKRVVSARQQRFACCMHKAPEKVTLRGGGLEIHKHAQLNHTLTDSPHCCL